MKKIVVIEDDTDVQEIYVEILSKHKYHVYPAQTADLGLQLIEQQSPDLIILDLVIPSLVSKFNGAGLLSHLKDHPKYSRIPVFVVSNLSYPKEQVKMMGAADYLEKSNTTLAIFLRKVEHLLGEHSDNHE